MNECSERTVEVGFTRNPKDVFDEVDQVTAEMIRAGWILKETCVEDSLGNVHLFFEREMADN